MEDFTRSSFTVFSTGMLLMYRKTNSNGMHNIFLLLKQGAQLKY